MDVIDETGARVRFGDLVRNKKTIVVFIRHCKLHLHLTLESSADYL